MSHWKFRGKDFNEMPEDAYGFVYLIVNKETGEKYIGRKKFMQVRRRKVKGRKNRKVTRKESKWREYTGSNDLLNEQIKKGSKSNFEFHVLAIAFTKGQLTLLEEASHHKLNVILDDSYYNEMVSNRRFMNVKIDDKFRNSYSELEENIQDIN